MQAKNVAEAPRNQEDIGRDVPVPGAGGVSVAQAFKPLLLAARLLPLISISPSAADRYAVHTHLYIRERRLGAVRCPLRVPTPLSATIKTEHFNSRLGIF